METTGRWDTSILYRIYTIIFNLLDSRKLLLNADDVFYVHTSYRTLCTTRRLRVL